MGPFCSFFANYLTSLSAGQESLSLLRSELRDLQQQFANSESKARAAQQAITRYRQEASRLEQAIKQKEDAVDKLQDELDRDSTEDGRLDALRKVKEEAEEELGINERSFAELILEKDGKNQEASRINSELQEIEEKLAHVDKRIKKAQAAYIRAQDESQKALQDHNTMIESTGAAKDDLVQMEQRRDDLHTSISEMISQASRVCDRVPLADGDTPANLEKKVQKLNQDLTRYGAE